MPIVSIFRPLGSRYRPTEIKKEIKKEGKDVGPVVKNKGKGKKAVPGSKNLTLTPKRPALGTKEARRVDVPGVPCIPICFA